VFDGTCCLGLVKDSAEFGRCIAGIERIIVQEGISFDQHPQPTDFWSTLVDPSRKEMSEDVIHDKDISSEFHRFVIATKRSIPITLFARVEEEPH
jgi:hypothetical protein